MSGSGASGLTFSIINHTFVTRGMDDTVKLFDLRNTKKTNGSGSSVAAVTGIPNFFEETNIVFSPDERFVVTGTSVKRSMVDNFGKLMFFDAKTLEHCGSSSSSSSSTTTLNQSDIEVSRANSVVRVAWHSRINQIVCGVSNGDVHVMYDPHTSSRGAKMVLSKAPKIRRIEDTLVFGSLE